MKHNVRMLSLFMAFLMVVLCIPVVALDEVATGGSITQAETNGTTATDIGADGASEGILYEDTSKRDAFSKHYTTGDGSYYAIAFPEQVHYFENEEWKEIDNSLQYNSVSGRYESANQIFATGFAVSATEGDAVSVTNGDYTVSWSLVFAGGEGSLNADANAELITAQPALIVNGQSFEIDAEATDAEAALQNAGTLGKAVSAVTYADLQNGKVDVRYSVYHGKVKEDVIVESADALTSYALVMDTDGLTAIKNADNSVSFVDAQGEEYFTMDAPWMKDSYTGVSHDVAVEVMQKGNQAIISYTPDAEWMQAEERVYPVLIDPSFRADYYSCNIVDTYVFQGDTASATRANESTMKVGYKDGNNYLAYLNFVNLPKMVEFVQLQEVYLDFWLTDATDTAYMTVYEVTEAWNASTISYANRPEIGDMLIYETGGTVTGGKSKYSFDFSSHYLYNDYESTMADYFQSAFFGYCIESTDYAQIYSSTGLSDYRPSMRFKYVYAPHTCLESGAVYSFVNSVTGEYMTVSANAANASVSLASKNNGLSQAFRLYYDSSINSYYVRAMLSENGGTEARVLDCAYDVVYGDQFAPLQIDNKQATAQADSQQWLIEYVGNGLFRIVLRANSSVALTGFANDDYESDSLGAATDGSICGTNYRNLEADFANETSNNRIWLWKLESGGKQVFPGVNSKDQLTISRREGTTNESLYCVVSEFGANVSWSSNNTVVATVSNGRINALKAGTAQIVATVTSASGTVTTYTTTFHVHLEDGVYYINNVANSSYRIGYDSLNAVGEGEKLYLYNSGTAEETSRKALFKIRYLGEGLYSIRSMLDSSMGWVHENNQTSSATIGYTDADIEGNEKWGINSDALGYYIYGYNEGRVIAAPTTVTDGVELTSTAKLSNTNQRWTITQKVSYSHHGVYMPKKTGQLIIGQSFQFDAVFYTSSNTYNGGNNIIWSMTTGTGGANFDPSTGTLTATSAGTVTVTAKYTRSETQVWERSCTVTIFDSFPEGVYLIENARYGTYLQQSSAESDVSIELAEFSGSDSQLWYIVDWELGEYGIQSIVDNNYLEGVYNGSYSEWLTWNCISNFWAATAIWYIIPVNDGIYRISSKANTAYHMTVDNTGENVVLGGLSEDNSDEWILHPISETIVDLEVLYDQAYSLRYSNAVNRIENQLIAIRKKMYFEFDIWVNYSVPTLFTSYADECSTNYAIPCTHGNCSNSSYLITKPYHHKNIYNIFHHINPPNTNVTLKLAYIGHQTCYYQGNEHEYGGIVGLANMDYGLAMVASNGASEASELKTSLHEFCHLYGAPDHYNRLGAPSTAEKNSEVEGAPFSEDCIFGEYKNNDYVMNNLLICAGCRDAIESNKNEYDHG